MAYNRAEDAQCVCVAKALRLGCALLFRDDDKGTEEMLKNPKEPRISTEQINEVSNSKGCLGNNAAPQQS